MRPITTLHLPWDEVNPYQRLLAHRLEAVGVQVLRPWKTQLFSPALLRRAELIHLHWLHHFFLSHSSLRSAAKLSAFFSQLLLLKMAGLKIIWTVHNLYNHERQQLGFDLFCSRKVAHLADAIIVHCPTAGELVEERWGPGLAPKIKTIPHGHYREVYPPLPEQRAARIQLGMPTDSFVFLFLGHLRPYKGVRELLAAFQQWRRPEEIRLLVAGKPADVILARQMETAAGRDSAVFFHPRLLSEKELSIYLAAADVVVCPYRDILTSGMVVLAMSFGKPVIAPRLGCLPDMLAESGAFLYEPDEEEALLAALRAAYESRDQLAQIGNHHQRRALSWSWSNIARQTRQVYEECLKRR